MQREVIKLIWDACEALSKASQFVDGVSIDRFREDQLVSFAVERTFEIAGEAFKRLRDLSPETLDSIPEAHLVIGLRNVIAHGYDVVGAERIYEIASRQAGPLAAQLRRLLESEG